MRVGYTYHRELDKNADIEGACAVVVSA